MTTPVHNDLFDIITEHDEREMGEWDEQMAQNEISDYNAEQLELGQSRFEDWVGMMERDFGGRDEN